MKQNDYMDNTLSASQIDLDAGTDAKVIGNLKTQDFLIIIAISAGTLLLFSLLGFLPFFIRIFLFGIPIATGVFFQADGPRRLKIHREFSARDHDVEQGKPLEAAYEWGDFKTLKNFIVVEDYVIVFANLMLPPTDLFSTEDHDMLAEGMAAMVRTTVQSGAVIETYLFHRPFVPDKISNIIREKYWMETGTSRYVTELYIRIVFSGKDVAKAEMLSNRIRRAYFSNGGKGDWIWTSAAVAAQESHDALNPGAVRKRYLEMISNANRSTH